MKQGEEKVILLSLRNGLGFSKSCYNAGTTPQIVEEYMSKNPEFEDNCKENIRTAYRTLAAVATSFANDKQWGRWEIANEKCRNFNVELVLWESFCLRADLDDMKFMQAVLIYKDEDDIPTAIGMNKLQYVTYLLENMQLKKFVRDELKEMRLISNYG